MTSLVDEIKELFAEKGGNLYYGENVTEKAHALQCAHLAASAGVAPELIAAALLHDVGHLLHGLSEDIAEQGIDGEHERIGAEWLQKHFPPAVVDPVRMHVAAKRYLCAVEPSYLSGLSPASTLSLKLQGGPMSPEEIHVFEAEPHFRAAIAVRRWDDGAKVPDLDVPPVEHYRGILESVCRAG